MKNIIYRLAIILTALSVLSLATSCKGGSGNIFKPDVSLQKNLSLPLNENAFIKETESSNFIADPADKAIVDKQMKPVLSNEFSELYFGRWNDIALRDKASNAIVFSNREAYDPNIENASNDLKETAYSQISLEYYNLQNEGFKMSSYPDAFDNEGKNQVNVKTVGDVFSVTYILGTKIDSTGLLLAMQVKTFDQLYQKADQLARNGEISKIEVSKLKGWYSKVVLANMTESEQKKLLESYPVIKELGTLYILRSTISESEQTRLSVLLRKLGVDQTFIDDEMNTIGNIKRGQKSALYSVTLNYKLNGADLLVWIDTKDIVACDNYFLNRISLVGSFGASKPTEPGYMFTPDGSGSIIDNKTVTREIDTVGMPFYGSNFGLDIKNKSDVQPTVNFPVYGIKRGNQSVFAIVESGDAMGGINASLANKDSAYNRVSLWMDYMVKDTTTYSGMAAAKVLLFSKTVPNVQFRVRYHILAGDSSSYNGMAEYYRKYLVKTGVLIKSESISKSNITNIELIGGITLAKQEMGVRVSETVAATTFSQARELVNELSTDSKGPLNVQYSGALEGGIDTKIIRKIEFDPSLGDLSGWNTLQKSLSEKNGWLSLGINLMQVYQPGNGLSAGNDLIRLMNKNYAKYSSYNPGTGLRSEDRMAYLLKPSNIAKRIPGIMDSLKKKKIECLYLPNAGSLLYGDYTTEKEVSREEARITIVEQLKKLDGSGYSLTVDGAGLFAVPYADRLANISVESSHSRIESYDIPFVSMVLHGYKPMNTMPLNEQPNYRMSLLKAVESGVGMSYRLMAADNSILFNSHYTEFMSMSAGVWMKEIKDVVKEMTDKLDGLGDKQMTGHEVLQEGVVRVTYENGTKVILNYTEKQIEVDGISIGPMNFEVKK